MGRDKKQFKQLLQLLPEGWEEKAKEFGALQRARHIKTPEELLRLNLMYLTEGKSMAGTSAILNLSGEATMSKVAVFKRIQRSGEWLEWMCKNIYRRAGLLIEKPQWLKDRNVLLIDGSADVKGGSSKRHYFMLHYSMDLFTLTAREFLITDEKTGERLVNFKQVGDADIVIADRAYGTTAGIAHLNEHGADYILRLRAGAFTIYDKNGQAIDLMEQFSRLMAWNYGEVTGWLDSMGGKVPVRICAVRKDIFTTWKGMERLKKENQRKRHGKPVSVLQQEYNNYIMVVTSLGKEIATKQVLELYRTRWQIEIAFKRLKSLFEYNEMPARKKENIKTWFYGKMLLAALCEALVNTGRFFPQEGTNGKRRKAAQS
jgi:hypothetical protein